VLSVVMPIYNEQATLEECLRRVFATGLDLEVIAVDDGSDDGSTELLAALTSTYPDLRVFRHEKRSGKGAALRTGFAEVRGDYVVIQDADLEYDPREYPVLLEPLLDGRADVVYGSRFLSGPHRVHLFLHYVGNRFLTFVSNLFTNLNLTDMETCYKAFRRPVVDRLKLKSRSFTVEPEITAKVAKMRARVYEVPISYSGRDFEEGKKIRWSDGLRALWAILRFNLCTRRGKPLDR
jgi:glycosyltransferase involved in cell wall biosynthesis